MDPHTEYFAPVEKRQFDEEISGRFYGIGASLMEDKGLIKIATLITGSPAWKSGKLQVNDEVVKVAQGNETAVDVAGYAVTDVVKLIRGSKGTEVKITIKKADGTTQVVSIVRDEILLEDTFARSAVVNDNGKKIGYIFLPDFYFDPNDPRDGPRCSVDVANEVTKLKGESVDGIIIVLRNNGGGSLNEVVKMVGLFIKTGPIVQVRGRDGKPSLWSDNDAAVLYDGPLAVMVNEFSASASEIFAAAIQDYKRGIIVGSTTYGKGTVQTSLPLGKPLDMSGRTEYGALKITFQKFYRVNGGSTQLRGVTPDIVLPDPYDYLKLREKDNNSALGWDQIPAASYEVNNNKNWDNIQKKEQERIRNNETFNKIKNNTEWLSKNIEKEYSLNINGYKKEQNLIKNMVKQDDSLIHLKEPMNLDPVAIDRDKFYHNQDSTKGERNQQWLKNVKSDLYISETVNIVKNMITGHSEMTAKQ
jgi:carboxyl-terminal processing protease